MKDNHRKTPMPATDWPELPFTPDDVELIGRERRYDGYFALDRYHVRHRRYDGGWSAPIYREVFISADAVAVLPYDPIRDEVVMIEQFRAGPYAHSEGQRPLSSWLVEPIAGRIETNEAPEEVARREALEEAGCLLNRLVPIGAFFQSPGCISEKIHYFCALTDSSRIGGVHGCADEDEDIRVIVLGRKTALAGVQEGRIGNITLAFALLWLELNRDRLLQGD